MGGIKLVAGLWVRIQISLNGRHSNGMANTLMSAKTKSVCILHSLNIELDLQSVFGVLCTAVLIG
jgi:hypothetical protein